jgi:hypothetical protein
MLLPYLPVLNEKKIILGSQSKSRNELITTQVQIAQQVENKIRAHLKQICRGPRQRILCIPRSLQLGNLQGKSEGPAVDLQKGRQTMGYADLWRYHCL